MAILQPLFFPQVLFIHLIVLSHFFQQLCHFSILHMGWYWDQYCSVSSLSAWPVDQNTPSVRLQMMPNGREMVNTQEGTVQRGCGIPILGDFHDSIRQVPQQPDLNSKLVLCTSNWFGWYPEVSAQHKFLLWLHKRMAISSPCSSINTCIAVLDINVAGFTELLFFLA